jgi:hypothetical protein
MLKVLQEVSSEAVAVEKAKTEMAHQQRLATLEAQLADARGLLHQAVAAKEAAAAAEKAEAEATHKLEVAALRAQLDAVRRFCRLCVPDCLPACLRVCVFAYPGCLTCLSD